MDRTLFGRLPEQLTLLLALHLLPRVFDNNRGEWVHFAMGPPASRRAAGDAACGFHYLVKDKPFVPTLPFDLDKLLAVFRDNCWVETELLLTRPQEPKDRRHKPQSVLINVVLFRGNAPKPIKRPYSHERSAEGKAQNEAAVALRAKHFPYVPAEIEPRF